MKVNYGTHYLIRFKDGSMWSFFSDDKNNIYQQPLNKFDEEANKTRVISNVQREFGVCMDEFNHIHLICISCNGDIIYMDYNEGKWSENILYNKDNDKYIIRYPSIVVLGHEVHIILAISNMAEIGHWSLCHYFCIDNSWNRLKIADFRIDQDLGPFYMDIYNQDIHLTYGGMLNGDVHTFHIKYEKNLHKWLGFQGDKTLPTTEVEYRDEKDHIHIESQEPDLLKKAQVLASRAETAYKNHISITRESDELRRRCMESKRQWELILEELNELKISLSKQRKGNILGNILKSILQ